MELTPGEYTDYNVVEHRIKKLAKKFNIREIAFDPHGGQQLMNNLDHSGFEVFKFIQSYTNFAPTVLAFDRLMLSRALKHNGNKVLDWCASNVSLDEQVATEQKRPSKRRSSEKIDGIVALLMALGRSMSSEKQSASAYVKRGLFS
jgi:phage terminase large subunit-like protein